MAFWITESSRQTPFMRKIYLLGLVVLLIGVSGYKEKEEKFPSMAQAMIACNEWTKKGLIITKMV